MLNKQDILSIYGLFADNFHKCDCLSLKEAEDFLKEMGFNYQEFGYKNMLDLVYSLSGFLKVKKSPKEHSYQVIFTDYTQDSQKAKPSVKTNSSSNNKAKAASEKTKEKKAVVERLPFNDKEKDSIYKLLLSYFPVDQDFPMATVSKTLIDNGVNYKRYGFHQMKNLLKNMGDRLTLKEVAQSGVPQTLVRVNQTKVNKVQKNEQLKKENRSLKKPDNQTLFNKAANFFIPDKIIDSIKETSTLGLDAEGIRKLISKDYQDNLKDHKLHLKDDAIIFNLSFKNRSDEDLIGAVKAADKNSSYKYYLNYVGDDQTKAKDALKDSIYFPDYEKSIQELASLAKKESWCYHHSKDNFIILKIYLQYTFAAILSQGLLTYNDKTSFGAFNTGLVTEDYQEIYGVVQKNKLPKASAPYLFQGFAIPGSQGLGKVIVESFNPLPQKAKYINSAEDVFFDTSSSIFTDYHHIIFDNLDRIPIDFLSTLMMPFKDENQLLTKIKKEKNEFKKDQLFHKLSDAIAKNHLLYNLIHSALFTTIERAKTMVKQDYRLALPSFFPTRSVMSMMIPLVFDVKKGVEAVLLIEHNQSGNYQGQTILTLKQCYVNARLIGPLRFTYLDPDKIED